MTDDERTDLERARTEAGLSRRELGRLAKSSPNTIRKYEEREKEPEPHVLGRLMQAIAKHGDPGPQTAHRDGVSFRAGGQDLRDPALGTGEFMHQAIDQLVAETEAVVRDALIKQLRDHGVRPDLPAPDEPDYEVGWTDPDGSRCIAEVAAVAGSSNRLWTAMGRLLAAESQLDGEVRLFVALDKEPRRQEWVVLRDRGIVPAWLGGWESLGLDQENDQPAE